MHTAIEAAQSRPLSPETLQPLILSLTSFLDDPQAELMVSPSFLLQLCQAACKGLGSAPSLHHQA